jgi:hypothetical protein
MDQFVSRCLDFYGPAGIYPLGFTERQIRLATDLLLTTGGEFCGDTADRERVRDIRLATCRPESVQC